MSHLTAKYKWEIRLLRHIKQLAMSFQDTEFREELIQLVMKYGGNSQKLLKRFTLKWSKDNDGAIQLDGYTCEWKYKDEIKKTKKQN